MFEIQQFHHASILVKDLAISRQFYEEILGLTLATNRPKLPFDGVWYQLGPQQIHLLELPDPTAGIERPEHGGRDSHIALVVSDFDALVEKLDQEKIIYSRSKSGRQALFCRDPDNNAIELIGKEQMAIF